MRVGISINGLLILIAAVTAWRLARARRVAAHRRWALRSFILISGVWFFRVGMMCWILLNQGPVGIGGKGFDGPFVRFWAFGCYLVPLALLELYLRAQDRGSVPGRYAMATVLAVLTLGTAIGIFGAAMGMWLPRLT
jgi:asparagine N-glycosylation enzyme membrane subunit Stt3